MAGSLRAWPLVLLDLQDEYEKFESELDTNIFHRFTDRDNCLRHQRAVADRVRLLYFFVPHSEHGMIGAGMIPMTTIYHLYCGNNEDARLMNEAYNMPMMVKIFLIKDLLIRLRNAATDFFVERATRTTHEPDERDLAFHSAAELADQMAIDLRNHMEVQMAVEAVD